VGIEFGRGAFENPDDQVHDDDVDTSIIVVTSPEHVEAVGAALERCCERWWGIDGEGTYRGDDDAAFWDAQPYNQGVEWHTAKYISDVVVTPEGVAVDVDCQGLMPAAMRGAYRQVLVEELEAAGIRDAIVRSPYEADYAPPGELPAGGWPPYTDLEVPGLPPGVPPGRVIHHELRKHSDVRNWFLQRTFAAVWEASAAAVADGGEEEAVLRTGRLFSNAGWAVGEPQATQDWDHRPLTSAAMAMAGAVAVVTCQAARHVKGRGLQPPRDAQHVIIAVAYYDLDRPIPSPTPETVGDRKH
jgi:hypothetical protein